MDKTRSFHSSSACSCTQAVEDFFEAPAPKSQHHPKSEHLSKLFLGFLPADSFS